MKLAMIELGGDARPALVTGDSYTDIGKHLPGAPSSVVGIIKDWDNLRDALQALEGQAPDGKVADIKLAAPIQCPGKIFAIGLNYADHCEETGMSLPEHQIWFTKAASAVNAPFAPIEIPAVSDTLDYEAEMVVVIGKTCRNVPAERFGEVVFGYCVGNDVSVREWQTKTPQWSLGKSFDTTAPIGPWITTADEVDPNALGIRAWVNDELRQNSNTKHLVFNVAAQIAQLSKAMTLEPGDLIFTGTPGGVGMTWKGSPHYLKQGDRSKIEIDGLGSIEAVVTQGSGSTRIG
jgi:2-keto-4-pentenoate hydratase/2-oxohepta-3-ene-1,7-dioic acid hydratase in catechol pathway